MWTPHHISRYNHIDFGWVTWCGEAGRDWVTIGVYPKHLEFDIEFRNDICEHCKAEFLTSLSEKRSDVTYLLNRYP